MMTSSCIDDVIFNTFCLLLFVIFVIEILHNLQNFGILQYYFHYIIQQLMKMNIFLCKCNLFRETAEKSIFLNYDVSNDVMMMQCIYLEIKYFISTKD